MANNNIQNVRFLRNGTLFTSREQATSALTNFELTSEMDGSSILARYQVGTDPIKTLVGYVYYKDASNNSVTIFDIDDAGSDVDEKIKTAIKTEIDKLDYTDSAVPGQYVSQVSQADGKISVSRVALPDASSVSGDSKVLIDVTQDKGQIKASAANLSGVKLDGYSEAATTGDVASTDTLGEALGKLQKTIHEMDKPASAEDGKVVTTISENDGVVSEIKANVKDLQLGGYDKDTSATGNIASTDTINAALSKLENKAAAITIANADKSINVKSGVSGTDINVNIKSGELVLAKDGSAGLYTDIKLSGITVSSEAVKEEYALIGTNGSQLGTSIKVYKDSHIVSITYITDPSDAKYQNLKYVYIDASGATKTEYVDISSLVLEAEFASGITVTDHVARGVVDQSSEKDSSKNSFLTVGADGFKVDGIKGEIDTKINALGATVGSTDVEGGKHVAVQVVENAGKLTALTVTETNIASDSALAAEIAARKAVDGQNGDTYAKNANVNYIGNANSLNDADIKLDIALKAVDDAMLTGVVAGDGITVLDNGNKSQTISVKVKNDDGIVIDETGLHLGYIDAGIY